jgi:hypothetical protein
MTSEEGSIWPGVETVLELERRLERTPRSRADAQARHRDEDRDQKLKKLRVLGGGSFLQPGPERTGGAGVPRIPIRRRGADGFAIRPAKRDGHPLRRGGLRQPLGDALDRQKRPIAGGSSLSTARPTRSPRRSRGRRLVGDRAAGVLLPPGASRRRPDYAVAHRQVPRFQARSGGRPFA